MIGWIERIIGNAAGIIDETIRRWIHDIINGLYGFMHLVFGAVGDAWSWLYRNFVYLYQQIGNFFYSVYISIWHVLYQVIPGVIGFASRLFNDAWNFIRSVLSYAYNSFLYALHYADRLVQSAEQWVIRDIWNPIWRTLSSAWSWITRQGATLWFYLTHPSDFTDLIWDALLAKIEREAWMAGALLGRFFVSLIVHNIRRFAILLEDILTAVL